VTNTPPRAPDPVEDAVATILRDGGAVILDTDLGDTPDKRCDLRVSYRGRNSKRIELAGAVTAWGQRDGPALEEIGWVPRDVLDMQRLERTWVRQAEERWLERGIDYRREYVQTWELPPATAVDLVDDLRTTLQIVDGRPAEQVRYLVSRDGPLEKRVVRSGFAFGLLSLLLGIYASAYLIFTPTHEPLDQIVRAVIAGVAVFLLIFFPVRRRIQRMRGAGKWGRLPYWSGMLFLPGATIFAWAIWGV
jgi:hypothetical protein